MCEKDEIERERGRDLPMESMLLPLRASFARFTSHAYSHAHAQEEERERE